jgi:hypothetical protein
MLVWLSVVLLSACNWGPDSDTPIGAVIDSECQSVAANESIAVTQAGHYENPDGLVSNPGAGCGPFKYIVDFISQRRMSSFKPDRDWLNAEKFTNALACTMDKDCNGDGALDTKFTADVTVYSCATQSDCAAHIFRDKVGTYSVFYRPLEVIGTGGQLVCHANLGSGNAIQTARDAYGVRIVISHDILARINGECGAEQDGFMPTWLGFNASGTAGFPKAGPLKPGRPKAEPD